jgi:hypothetical protein
MSDEFILYPCTPDTEWLGRGNLRDYKALCVEEAADMSHGKVRTKHHLDDANLGSSLHANYALKTLKDEQRCFHSLSDIGSTCYLNKRIQASKWIEFLEVVPRLNDHTVLDVCGRHRSGELRPC